MPVTGRAVLAAALLAALGTPAAAQTPGEDRFFTVAEESDDERQKTAYDGSLTSTTFYYRESGAEGPPPVPGGQGALSASPVDRLFTDLRAQLDARHISGSRVDFHGDVRGRFDASAYEPPSSDTDYVPPTVRGQSGAFGDNELEVRELYFKRQGSEFDVTVGRHFVLELAATKIDGLQLQRKVNPRWRWLAFGGLYPSRISRDVREDYPVGDNDPDPVDVERKRIMPLAGGLGAAYRVPKAYGAFGVVGIMPLANDYETGKLETPRIFGHSNGYWRPNMKIDFFHYGVVDAMGAAGFGLTNLTLGMNFQPTQQVRTYAQVSRIDTETLNVTAQTKLEEPDPAATTGVQNNIEVKRIAQDAARVGISVGFKNRFEVSTSGALRRRPELRIDTGMADEPSEDTTDDIVFPAAQAADITLAFVDRKSLNDMRIGLSVTRSFAVGGSAMTADGNPNLNRTSVWVGRLDASKEVAEGKGEVEGNLTFIDSRDDNRTEFCVPADIDSCYGSAQVQSITLGGLGFYRFRRNWFLVGSAAIGRQIMAATGMTTSGVTLLAQPAVLTLSAFLRIAYRF